MKKWRTIHKEITINQDTLNTYNEYVDFIHLNDEKISIRLIIKKQFYKKQDSTVNCQLSSLEGNVFRNN